MHVKVIIKNGNIKTSIDRASLILGYGYER